MTYETRDGTGKDGSEYVAVKGKLEFPPSTQEETKFIEVKIVDDDVVEPDMDFYIDLFPDDETCEVLYLLSYHFSEFFILGDSIWLSTNRSRS